MPKKSFKSNDNDQDFISKLLDDLQSQGFVEKLRLECVVDVKTKPTYLQLKERLKDYVTNRMSSGEWCSDDTFREQVVECGVIALTIERIVEQVVSRKLREQFRPFLIELMEEQLQNRKFDYESAPFRSSFAETMTAVQKICSDTKQKAQAVLGGGLIAHSLATVSLSKMTESDDEMLCSDVESELSDHSGNNDQSEHERARLKPVIKGEPGDKSMENSVVSNYTRRERKINPKYSDMYYTTFRPPSQHSPSTTPRKSGAPKVNGSPKIKNIVNFKVRSKDIKKEMSDSSDSEDEQASTVKKNNSSNALVPKIPLAKRNGMHSSTRPVIKRKSTDSDDEDVKPPVKKERNGRLEKVKSLPIQNGSPSVQSKYRKNSHSEVSNDSIRKSGRQRKVNSIIFWDALTPNSASTKETQNVGIKEEPLARSRATSSISDDLESMAAEVQIKKEVFAVKSTVPPIKSSVPAVKSTVTASKSIVTAIKSSVPSIKSPVSAIKSLVTDIKSPVSAIKSAVPVKSLVQSRKRYDSSDLYKPRLALSSSSRAKTVT